MAVAYYHYLTVAGAALLLEDGTPLLLEDGSGALLLEAYSMGVDFQMTTLFDLTYKVARELGTLEEGLVTSGSTSTVVDSNDRTEDADYWNGGTVWILRDAAGAGAAPEGEYAIVSDFATPTVSLRSNFTVAPASGDRYAISDSRVPLHIIISKINQALLDMGVVPYVDTTTITTADNKTEHSLPVGAGLDLREVWIQLENADSDDNRWSLVHGWRIQNSAIGTQDLLMLPTQYDAGYKIKLVYMALHPELFVYSDAVSEAVPVERVVYPAIRDCFVWLKQRTRRQEYDEDIARWTLRADAVKNTRPIIAPKKVAQQNVLWVQDGKTYPGDRTNLV